jgi:hypothetical protein
LDNLKNYLAWAWEMAKAFIPTKAGKVTVALLAFLAIVGYAHHRGVVSTTERLSIQEPASCPPAEPIQVPVPVVDDSRANDLAAKLSKSEQERELLQRKVSDYEKQRAKRGKAGALILSPDDARSLSNIR